MDPQKLPIVYQQLFELPKILPGLSPDSLSFHNITVGDRYLCVRDGGNVHIVDLNNWSQPVTRQLKADSTIMHPNQSILAIRAGAVLQVWNLATEPAKKLADYTHPEVIPGSQIQDKIEFWKWIDETTIALVTTRSVYHWTIAVPNGSNPCASPVKFFDRCNELVGHTITNYEVSHDKNYYALSGVSGATGRVLGFAQLYSVGQKGSQTIPSHACCFARIKKQGVPDPVLFCFVKRDDAGPGMLYVIEMGGFHKPSTPVQFPDANPASLDYPISLVYSPKFNVLYMLTAQGLFFLFDSMSVYRIMANKVSQDLLVLGAPHVPAAGILAINKPGAVLAITANEANMLNWILTQVSGQFQLCVQQGQYQQAAKLAADSPKGCLRTAQTIQIFKSLPSTPTSSPLRDYFTIVLDAGQLNEVETNELVAPVLAQRRADLIAEWLNKDKLFCTAALGRSVYQIDPASGEKIIERSGDNDEIAKLYAAKGDFQKLVHFAKENNYKPNWMNLLLSTLQAAPQTAAAFAKMLLKAAGGPLVDRNAVIDAFLEKNMVSETTTLLLDIYENKPEYSDLQTRILEINLKSVPHNPGAAQIVNAMFDNNLFSHYDHQAIAVLCEQVGMYQRALQLYTDYKDVRNLLVAYGATMPGEFVASVLSRFAPGERIDLLRELLKSNQTSPILQLVAAIAAKFTILPPEANPFSPLTIIKLFEEFNSHEGTFYYLRTVVLHFKDNKDISFKFIEAATKVGPMAAKDVESAVRDLEYDPETVREFLKENKLDPPVALIVLCNKHNMVADLTNFLYRGGYFNYIETFVQTINPLKTPEVVGALLDDNCSEEKIRGLINTVGHLCPVAGLVQECESRGRLLMLRQWLEQRYNEANKEPATHNALAKILISSGDERAETFLLNNDLYEPREVGKFAEDHNTSLALKIYQHHKCHMELINLTNQNGLYREQAHYLVYEQNPELWSVALRDDTDQRKNLIEQVIQTTLAEIKPERADVVSSTVQAFMVAKLPSQLMELLEKIVFETPGFADNRYLQNLLILTAIKASKSRVMDYVIRLNQYDPEDIASMSLNYKLPEVAFTIYKKFEKNVQAIGVLVNNIKADADLEKAVEFADETKEAPVFSVLGHAQLERGLVVQAIGSYLKANDGEKYEEVIAAAKRGGHYEELVKYLTMTRGSLKSTVLKAKERVDSELIYAYAKTKSSDLEIFVAGTHHANVPSVGETCFKEGLYEAAKILYLSIKNYPKLVSCLLKLNNFTDAVDYARKAGSAATWKEFCKACIDAQPPEFRFAQIAGGNVVNNPGSDLEEIANYYEDRGYTNELIALLESSLNTDTTINLSTTLAILYSKYKPEKLISHLQLFKKKLTIAKVVLVVRENQQWSELSYLFELDNDVDGAARVMVEHPQCWNEQRFKELIGKVKNVELLYESIKFYLNYQPSKVNDLLSSLTTRVDPTKVVATVKPLKQLHVVKKYLEGVQEKDQREVNNALNDLYIEEEDFEALRASVTKHQNFDSLGLAKRLESNDLLEFKRIASHLYKLNKKWKQSIDLSKAHKLYQDAMETVAESKDAALAEELLHFFVDPANNIRSPHCFSACLYACYDLLKPDVVLELAWKHKMIDFAFPFMIQTVRDLSQKVDALTAAEAARKEAAANQPAPAALPVGHGVIPGPQGVLFPPGMGVAGFPQGSSPIQTPGFQPQVGGVVPPPFGVVPQGLAPPPGWGGFQ